jgi:hypothetical protein
MDSFNLPKPRGRKLPPTKLRPLRISPGEWVNLVRPRDEAAPLPLVFRAAVDGVDLARWVEQNRALLDRHLPSCGGLLFTGFRLDSLAAQPTPPPTRASSCTMRTPTNTAGL